MLPEIVAEIGLNHNGSTETAKRIIDMIIAVAGEYPKDKLKVKFQKRYPPDSTPKHMWDQMRLSPVSGRWVKYIDYRYEIEFGPDQYQEIDEYCAKKGIEWFASVWDVASVEFMCQHFPHVPYLKVPSAHLTNDTLIQEIIGTGIPAIMSTGMSHGGEIRHAVDLFPDTYPLTLMACTANYPCLDEEVNLLRIQTLHRLYDHRSFIGYSNHHKSPYAVFYAMTMGVDMVEFHVTLDRSLPGSDQAISFERRAIELICREAQRIPVLMGKPDLIVLPSELSKRKSLRGY